MIENFDVSCFKPVSYELRLGSISALVGNKEIPDLKNLALPYKLKPGEYVIGKSIEQLKLPGNLMAVVVPTSFAIRIGLGLNVGKIDPTYNGEVNFGIHNLTKQAICLLPNLRLVHLLFSEFKGEIISLETKFFGRGGGV